MDSRHPPAEVDVDVGLARRLLESQHPGLATDDLEWVGEGWDNVLFRVGADRALRVPRREAAVPLLLNEQRWLPLLAADLDIPVPVPVAVGTPSDLFPWPWSVVRWIEGTTAEGRPLSPADAERLGATLRVLHRAAPPNAPGNPFRGVPLEARREAVEERLARLGLANLEPLWREALEAPAAEASVWIHGDLHPRNVLVRRGVLAGLIDWGDMAAGDAATDLACAWTLFDDAGRGAFRKAYLPDGAEWSRARGWAVNFGSAMLDSAEPGHVAIGRAIVAELLGDA